LGHLICNISKLGNANKNLSHDAQIPKQKPKLSYKNQYIPLEVISASQQDKVAFPKPA
jgi:hypothetical protein